VIEEVEREVLMIEKVEGDMCAVSATLAVGSVGVAVAVWMLCSWLTRGPGTSAPNSATVATQSPVTYSMLRGAVRPRFVVLAPAEQGVFAEAVQEAALCRTLPARPEPTPRAQPRRRSPSSSAGAQHQAEIQAREDWYADRSPTASQDASPESSDFD
jgi:hypothetical protein